MSLRALNGCIVLHWHGIEMALREVGEDGLPDWRDSSVPLLQLDRLDLTLADGTTASIVIYQNDDRWGLFRENALPPSSLCTDKPDCIFRSRLLPEIPSGQIRDVSVSLNEGDIEEVILDVEGVKVRLLSGEVYEQNAGSLRVVTLDSSILVQVDGRCPEDTSQEMIQKKENFQT